MKFFDVVVTERGYRLPSHKILRKSQSWDRATLPYMHHYHLNLVANRLDIILMESKQKNNHKPGNILCASH